MMKFLTLRTLLIAILFGAFMFLPVAVQAADCSAVDKGIFKGAYKAPHDKQPCVIDSFEQVFVVGKNIFNILVGIAGTLFIIFVVLGGIKYITSAGYPDRVKEAKDTITHSIIGVIVILLAYVIVNALASAFGGGATPK